MIDKNTSCCEIGKCKKMANKISFFGTDLYICESCIKECSNDVALIFQTYIDRGSDDNWQDGLKEKLKKFG